jgi:hypothetical protein
MTCRRRTLANEGARLAGAGSRWGHRPAAPAVRRRSLLALVSARCLAWMAGKRVRRPRESLRLAEWERRSVWKCLALRVPRPPEPRRLNHSPWQMKHSQWQMIHNRWLIIHS